MERIFSWMVLLAIFAVLVNMSMSFYSKDFPDIKTTKVYRNIKSFTNDAIDKQRKENNKFDKWFSDNIFLFK